MRFGRFESSLAYDPDLGVLFGNSPTKGGGADNRGLIVGVAVAVAVIAVAVVGVIITVVIVAAVKKRKQRRTRVHQLASVNYHNDL